MSERADTVARNQALFREVNERIREIGSQFLVPPPLELICECGDGACSERLHIGVKEYEAIRKTDGLFVVLPGHQLTDVEGIHERGCGYVVVEKRSTPV
jgi:hypothetical protein